MSRPLLSVLLPTRNGGALIESCIRSILIPGENRIELIVSDNANTDSTPEILNSFKDDPRLRVIRLEQLVPVTDNWNTALQASRGEYVLMMGDDDYLLPGYYERIFDLIDNFERPDCIIYNAYNYVFPNAIEGLVTSHYCPEHFRYGREFSAPQILPVSLRHSVVADMYRFRLRIPLNMQTIVVARRMFDALADGLFKPPFPDHYALNALLLKSSRFAFTPDRLLVVGISPKSFGHYVYSDQQEVGLGYLGVDSEFSGRLPGNESLNAMHIWLSQLKQDIPNELEGVNISRGDYVIRQIYTWQMQLRFGNLAVKPFIRRICCLSPSDWVSLLRVVGRPQNMARVVSLFRGTRRKRAGALREGLRPLPEIADIEQFASWITARRESDVESK